jgi:predicted transposase/invertase (TIGR01784 family)
MTKLEYTFKNDILFKIIFTKYQDLLKRLVADFLAIEYNSIEEFLVVNPELYPEEIGKKFCRLDINMKVNGQLIDLEIQVENEGNYPIRALYYWAREFSTALNESENYATLPRTIIISILGFKQFENPTKFHHEFQVLETTTYEPLTDKCVLHFYELQKLPPINDNDRGRDLWLKLFNAKTEEDLEKIARMEVPIMSQAIEAYRHVSATTEFRELERMRSKRRHDEAQALYNAEQRGAEREREKLQGVIADKDAVIADKDAELAEQAALIAKLQAQIGKNN